MELREASKQGGRLIFLDVLRLIAAVQMIQGHSVASVLAPAYREGPAYAAWTFARGLTSVLFLVTAGLAFVLAEARGNDARARRRRALRALRLIGIGYLMHAPLGVLLGSPLGAALRAAVVVDVLHCIGASLLLLELLTACTRAPATRAGLALALALLCLLAAPATTALPLSPALLPLGNYLTTHYGSLFPLVPWAGYVLAGFGLGVLVMEDVPRIAPRLLGAGAASLACGLVALRTLPALPLALSPAYCLVKLGCVLLLAGLCAAALRSVSRLPRLLQRLASETLFLYVSHVVILYADHVGLEPRLRDRHGPMLGVALALALLAVCGAAALAVRSLRASTRGGTRGAPTP